MLVAAALSLAPEMLDSGKKTPAGQPSGHSKLIEIAKHEKIILSTITLALIAASIAPASAINSKYRSQLLASGCTQITAGNGTCDIHKTKAQNAAAAAPKAKDDHAAKLRALGEDLLGEKASTASAALKAAGFTQTDAGIWLNM